MARLTTTDIARGFVSQADKHGIKKALRELAALLLEEHMHGQVDQLLDDIMREYQRRHGIIEATALSAYPLSTELKQLLSNVVKQHTKAKTVMLHEVIDRSLLGGVTVTAPDMELDISLRTKLNKLRA